MDRIARFLFLRRAIIVAVPVVGIYLSRERLGITYLDALAAGFPLGMAVGRVGDLINGEHYGPVSDLPWAVQNSHPAADVPSNQLAYHSGGLYEVLLALLMLAVLWPLRDRLVRPGAFLCSVIAMYAAGRFAMFFVRDDSTILTLGLSFSQWASLAARGGSRRLDLCHEAWKARAHRVGVARWPTMH